MSSHLRRAGWFAIVIGVIACERSAAPTATKTAEPAVAPTDAAPATAAPATAAPAANLPTAFTDALRRAAMTFTLPPGFTPVPTVDNPQWNYDFAMQSADRTVEVRIRVDPLDEDLAKQVRCKQDPTCLGTDPNAHKEVWLMAIAGNIGGGHSLPEINPLPADRMRENYGADYGAVAEVVPDAVMQTSHKQALVFLIHKDDRADAVFVVLHDGLREDQVPAVLQGLRFAP